MTHISHEACAQLMSIHSIQLQASQTREQLLAFARENGLLTKHNFPRFIEALATIDIDYDALPERMNNG